MIKVNERIIAKANLSREEAKVIRCAYGLSSAGRRTRNWVAGLNGEKYKDLLSSAQKKIRKAQ